MEMHLCIISVSTNSVAQNMQKRTPLSPSLQINTADGFTLGDRSANGEEHTILFYGVKRSY